MPRFVDPKGFWIALHNHDGVAPDGTANIEGARESHGYASRMAELDHTVYTEIADELGGPCTIFPNRYDPEIRPVRVENRG